MSYIKTEYFHIKGKPTASEADMGERSNYIMAELLYDKAHGGYVWSIRPIGQHVFHDKAGDFTMNTISYGLFGNDFPEIFRECLVGCSRRGKAREREAVELFDSNVLSAIKNRLGYDVEVEITEGE